MIKTENNTINYKNEKIELPGIKETVNISWENNKVEGITINFNYDYAGLYNHINIKSYLGNIDNVFALLESYFEERYKEKMKPNIQKV